MREMFLPLRLVENMLVLLLTLNIAFGQEDFVIHIVQKTRMNF